MAMITCPSCGKPVSDEAESCPSCGQPIKKKDVNHAHRAGYRSGAITGLIGGVGYILLFVLLSTGLFNKAEETTKSSDASISVESGQNPTLLVVGVLAVLAVTALFLAGVILAKRLKRTPAIILAAAALVVSVIGMIGIFFYTGMLAICLFWLVMWQPILEVVGASRMLLHALKYEE